MTRSKTLPLGYSYIRFSGPEQAKGDSVRRQTTGAEDWCRRKKVVLDEHTTLHDLGKSAFLGEHRKNPDRHRLAAFLQMVKDGDIPKGSYLIIENLDRLTREDIRPALKLLLDLIDAGIRVVQLQPTEMIFDEAVEPMTLMMAIMELSRGHGESALKSDRVGKAWREKKRRAREGMAQAPTARMGEGCKVVTKRLPAWIELRDGKPVLIRERVAVLKEIFRLSVAGHGLRQIVGQLKRKGVPVWGGHGRKSEKRGEHDWSPSYLQRLLADKRVIGEYQPRTRRGGPDGDPIPNYYPAAIGEPVFYAARGGSRRRAAAPGRICQHLINPFASLLHNARDGKGYCVRNKTSYRDGSGSDGRHLRLVATEATAGRGANHSFPYATFEAAILARLAEVKPRDILPANHDGEDEVLQLSGERDKIKMKIAELEDELLRVEVAALARVLERQEDRLLEVEKQLAVARSKAANPVGDAWGQAKSLLGLLATSPNQEDTRIRLRAALRTIVESIWVLVVPRGGVRLAAVQIFFTGGAQRAYLIVHRAAIGGAVGKRKASWTAKTLADAAKAGGIDLRRRADAEEMDCLLKAVDVDELAS